MASRRLITARDRADLEQWLLCPKVGGVVTHTAIVPCKTPLEGALAEQARAAGILRGATEFRRAGLLELCRAAGNPVGLVIDLVNTHKYYPGFAEADGVEYRKIQVPGKAVPSQELVETVLDAIDGYVARRPSPDLHVALHCTHGVNRTGFFVAAYLLLRTEAGANMGHKAAIRAFEAARGCRMDKEYLIEALHRVALQRVSR